MITYTALNDPLAANDTVAQGINNASQIVGRYQASSGAVPVQRWQLHNA
jgi:hypothetical protein